LHEKGPPASCGIPFLGKSCGNFAGFPALEVFFKTSGKNDLDEWQKSSRIQCLAKVIEFFESENNSPTFIVEVI